MKIIKRENWKKLAISVLMFAVLITFVPVSAKASVNAPDKIELTLYPKNDAYKDIRYDGTTATFRLNKSSIISSTSKMKNLKSSNTAVATVSQRKYRGSYYVDINLKKAGTTIVSFKEKSKTYRVKVIVKKYVNAVSSVKIGATTLPSSKFKSHAVINLNYSKFAKKKAKVTIKLKNGWELAGNSFWYFQKGWTQYSINNKNKKKITIKGGKGFGIGFSAVNTSTGQMEQYRIQFK